MKTLLKLALRLVVVLAVVAAGVYGWAAMKDRTLLARTIDTHSVDFPIPFPLTDAEIAEATQGYAASVAISSLAGLAFMCDGSTPEDGRYSKQVDHCVTFVTKSMQPSGYLSATG